MSCSAKKASEDAEDWDSFWKACLNAVGPEAQRLQETALGKWEGIEAGLPLAWHFDQLRECGFFRVDYF